MPHAKQTEDTPQSAERLAPALFAIASELDELGNTVADLANLRPLVEETHETVGEIKQTLAALGERLGPLLDRLNENEALRGRVARLEAKVGLQ